MTIEERYRRLVDEFELLYAVADSMDLKNITIEYVCLDRASAALTEAKEYLRSQSKALEARPA